MTTPYWIRWLLTLIVEVTTTLSWGQCFQNTHFVISGGLYASTVTDLNEDNKPDIVVSDWTNGDVVVLLNDGNGQFGPTKRFSVGGQRLNPNFIAVGDFNGDRKLDLAVTHSARTTIAVLLGDGNGNFGQPTYFSVPFSTYPFSIAVGDFNRDSKLDLAVACTGTGVSILLGDGNGGFQMGAYLFVGLSNASIAVSDFNGDNILDLVTANNNSGNISVLLGDGNGTFNSTDFAVGNGPSSVAVSDFNGDSKPDVAVANSGASSVSVLLNNGGGSFGPAANFTVGSGPISVAIGDFNGDSKSDLTVASMGPNTLSVLLGNGSGGFGRATDFSVEKSPTSVAVGDFNGDGKADLVSSNFNTGSVSILTNINCPVIITGVSTQLVEPFEATVLGNPARGAAVEMQLRGAKGQSIHLRVLNEQGRQVDEQRIESANSIEYVSLSLGQLAGLYLLHVSTPTQEHTIRIVKP